LGILYILAAITFIILFFINVGWLTSNLYLTIIGEIESFVKGTNPIENIYYSSYLKWILLIDVLWLFTALFFMIQRKNYKTNAKLHYLNHKPILNPKICVVLPAYNEAKAIAEVVRNFQKNKFVKYVIVIDNHSSDGTADIAEKCGSRVIRNDKNMGFGYSYALGLKESLKTDANIIVTAEADNSFNSYDIPKMLPYLDNCDMAVGTRQNQVLTEKGNQNSLLHVWGNFFLAKLIQIKYFSLLHTGVVNLTDVGCNFRLFRAEALKKIVNELTYPSTDKVKAGIGVAIHLTMIGIQKDLRIIELPVTFNKRAGKSKIGSNRRIRAIKIGLIFLWLILKT
jgi:glycosyltransferase involved in cell wall biosynthesis